MHREPILGVISFEKRRIEITCWYLVGKKGTWPLGSGGVGIRYLSLGFRVCGFSGLWGVLQLLAQIFWAGLGFRV